MPETQSYILRIQKDELERRLFRKRLFYVNINRDWSRDTAVLFVKKDAFIGSGIIERFTTIDTIEEQEKSLYVENNWYGKIAFGKLTRFVPPVPVRDTLAADQNQLALHGSYLSSQDALKIKRMAACRIVS